MNFYVLLNKEVPHRSCKSKCFITEKMFLASVACPKWDLHKKTGFEGKIRI